jgi:hypothetical protein
MTFNFLMSFLQSLKFGGGTAFVTDVLKLDELLKTRRRHCDRDGGFKNLEELLKLVDLFKRLRLHYGTILNDDDTRNGVNDDDGYRRKM